MKRINCILDRPKLSLRNILILSLLFFVLLYLRRSDQWIHPDIWDEDGMYNIPSFLANGWWNLLEPTHGYLVTVSKLITNTSLSLSFVYYPEISTWLTWLFTIVLSLIIVYAPSVLPYRLAASVMIYMVPAYAEPYGIPLYSFWFAGIFIILALLWQPSKHLILKHILLILGGLSSPIIIVAIPAQIFRLIFFEKKREELLSLLVVVVVSLIQLNAMHYIGHNSTSNEHLVPFSQKIHALISLLEGLDYQGYITFFFGKYYLGAFFMENYSTWEVTHYTFLKTGGIMLLILIISYWMTEPKDPYFYIFLYLILTMVFIVLYHAGGEIARLSPRYFFYVSIVVSWTLIYMMRNKQWYRFVVIPILLLSIVTSLEIYCKKSVSLHWRDEIVKCQHNSEKYAIPIHFAGSKENAWHMTMDPNQCNGLIENDWFEGDVQ